MNKNKKYIFLFISILILITLTAGAFLLKPSEEKNDNNKRQAYITAVQEIIRDLNLKSEGLNSIDPSDTEALIAAYEEILAIAGRAKYLVPPKDLADFDFKFQIYMYGLKTSYRQIIEGTKENDFFKVAKGLKELNSIDNSFLVNLK